MSAPYPPALSPRPKRWGVIAASALCWIWGTLMGLFYLPTFLEALRAGRPPSYLWSHGLAAVGIVALYWLAGYAMSKGRMVGAVTAIGVSGLVAVLVMLPPDLGGMIVAAINLTIIVLVILNLRHSKRAPGGVGA